MKRFSHFIFMALGTMLSLNASAQTDVTATYLTNPSFEADAAQCNSSTEVREGTEGLRGWNLSSITGWTTTSPGKQLLISADCATDNSFGKTAIADGTYAFYQRFGWGSATGTLSQKTTAALPAGKYQMTFRYKAFAANGAVSSCTPEVRATTTLGSETYSFEAGSTDIMGTTNWSTGKVVFTVAAPEAVTLIITNTFGNGGSSIAIDDVRLISIPDDYVEPTIIGGKETDVPSPTEGVITHDFVGEAAMMQDLLQMLTNHLPYMKSRYTPCASPTSKGEDCGYFKDTEGSGNDEKVVRPNADFSMVCAFLYKYAKGKTSLPAGFTWDEVKEMALKSLIWGYSSHNANKFKVTSRNAYWGSTSTSQFTWESSLWAMSLCYSAHFLMDELTADQKTYIYNMVKAECNYELGRSIPTGYAGDTKAEENGWEADILACALGLYPNDALASQWFDRLRAFAINSYSQVDDANDQTVIDPDYDQKTVASYYRGQNLYDDYTLQNHNLFHTSYQNVVQQELGEAHLAMLLFQGGDPKWKTNALMHNQQHVQNDVLNWLALADGELAMPNGNDWSLFLFDQITSYSTMACFLRDKNALLLENMAYKFIKARQTTTTDGSWLLRSDVGSRRMGVEAHRVMMTYLMHSVASTADLKPATWQEFSAEYQDAHLFKSQNIVRASSKDRFVTFSWSTGLSSYTGYFTDTTPDRNKIVCPYRANNTGNFLGWYNVSGKGTNATPVVSGIYDLKDNAFTMNGRINTNDATLENSFVLAATPGNAIVYMNHVKGLQSGTITGRRGGMLAITTDEFTRPQRTLYHAAGRVQTDGKQTTQFDADWANIDNSIGVVTVGGTGKMAFGEQANNNSINCSKFYPMYSAKSESFTKGKVVDRAAVIYYSQVDSATTKKLAARVMSLTEQLPNGWNGLVCADPDGTRYLIVANLAGGSNNKAEMKDVTTEYGAPVLTTETFITDSKGSSIIALDENHTLMQPLKVFIKGSGIAVKGFNPYDDLQFYVRTLGNEPETITITALVDGKTISKTETIEGTVVVRLDNGQIHAYTEEPAPFYYEDITENYIANPSFEEDITWGTTGNITLNNVTYNPCYTQSVSAASSNFPQVLPVKGWKAESNLSPASKFCLLYSMPYSFTQYCVSPSNVGNSASIMAVPAAFEEEVGARCLSILNSWTIGTNAISQTIQIPQSGSFALTFDLRYDCANESRHTAPNVIATTGGNVNTLLCGVVAEGKEYYAPFPAAAGTWEQMTVPFELSYTADIKDVTLRLGLQTTANQGAANQTRVYIDNVRLWQQKETVPVGIRLTPAPSLSKKGEAGAMYDLSGRRLSQVPQKGIFIRNGQKLMR